MEYPSASLSGEHIGKVIPVPIPNTAVKLSEPMIVHTSVKVGIARFLKNLVELRFNKVFLMRAWALQFRNRSGLCKVVDLFEGQCSDFRFVTEQIHRLLDHRRGCLQCLSRQRVSSDQQAVNFRPFT